MSALETARAKATTESGAATLEATEIRLLLEAIHAHYELDFREYAPASLRRRLWRRADAEGALTISGLQEHVDLDVLPLVVVGVGVRVHRYSQTRMSDMS